MRFLAGTIFLTVMLCPLVPSVAQNMGSIPSMDDDALVMPMDSQRETQDAQRLESLKDSSPAFYAMQLRLSVIRREIQRILGSYQQKESSLADAQAQIRPLLKEQLQIRNSLEYQVEQKVTALFSDPFMIMPPMNIETRTADSSIGSAKQPAPVRGRKR